MPSNENSNVRIILTPIKIVRDSTTGQWSTPKLKSDSLQKVKYNLRVRTPSTPVVSLSSPITKREINHTPRPLTRASRQISFEKDKDEYEPNQSFSTDEDDDDGDDDEDDDEDESSSSDDEKIISNNNNNRKSTLISKGTPATKKMRPSFLPRMNTLTLNDLQNNDDGITSMDISTDVFAQARQRLLPTNLPEAPPCREQESNSIAAFITNKLDAQAGGALYISGVPGVGKTAIVNKVVRELMLLSSDSDLPQFKYIFLNGMKLNKPEKIYNQLLQAIDENEIDRKRSSKMACKLLSKYFTDRINKKRQPTVLLLDEVDHLYTKNQTILYNMLEWPQQAYSKLIVIAIANTLDLPETMFKKKLQSRLGLNRVIFHPYTFKQLSEIVQARLGPDLSSLFDKDSLDLICRKVSSISGDVRRVLQICSQTLDMAQLDKSSKKVTLEHVQKTFERLYTSTRTICIRNLNPVQRKVLEAIQDELSYGKGREITTINAIYDRLDKKEYSFTDVRRICAHLSACGLLLLDKTSTSIARQSVRLSMPIHLLIFALKNNT
ncbi:unnamed protein product [Rotaria magnacalcarata]|uniref:Origin recognition complex subunit 1 n=4 Tax=Rotaria magnacalcarata TaxID=392030 RepID=A0A816XMV6_9BILA|nr:unnamed protein product [Rotaria magnacalcarata]CAF2148898.1 unnamed protein product [Rotaria magnacalcarata]CAF3775346.1 unnamed protein product [Rotaria magnacalcarata]CAF3953316.1 unnamed protein product [Rotaria magnacalcarata]